jgi:MoxR-like ATPase
MDLIYQGTNPEPTQGKPSTAVEALAERRWMYLPEPGLVEAVNVALLLEQPLLLTGKPGTGKTQLATALGNEFNLRLLKFETKSTSSSRDLFYYYNAIGRFQDKDGKRLAKEFITYNALGEAILRANPRASIPESLLPAHFVHPDDARRSIVLIDEVDKAPRDFPNDILNELENRYFRIPELDNAFVESGRNMAPIVVITSNSEKQLPDAFLRRCVYYDIGLPDKERLKEIVAARLGEHLPRSSPLLEDAVSIFEDLRSARSGLRRPPSTAELLGWVVVLKNRLSPAIHLSASDAATVLPTVGCLLKNRDDQDAGKRVIQEWFDKLPKPASA